MLQLWMFNGKTRASRTGLLSQATHVLKSGQVEEPVWYKAMREAPPLPTFDGPRPQRLVFPEVSFSADPMLSTWRRSSFTYFRSLSSDRFPTPHCRIS